MMGLERMEGGWFEGPQVYLEDASGAKEVREGCAKFTKRWSQNPGL